MYGNQWGSLAAVHSLSITIVQSYTGKCHEFVAESARTVDTSTVMFHENILDPPIPFEAGYVLGVLFIADNAASYIPLLYNVSGSDGSEGLVSYYESTRGSPQNDTFTLTANNIMQDTLFPLISLEIRKSNNVVVHLGCSR